MEKKYIDPNHHFYVQGLLYCNNKNRNIQNNQYNQLRNNNKNRFKKEEPVKISHNNINIYNKDNNTDGEEEDNAAPNINNNKIGLKDKNSFKNEESLYEIEEKKKNYCPNPNSKKLQRHQTRPLRKGSRGIGR